MSNLVVYGGAGALGRSIVTFFKEKGWTVTNIDMVENPSADHNAILDPHSTLQDQANQVQDSLTGFLGQKKLKAILCVAGGWAGGNAASKDFLANSELMWKQSVHSSFIAAQVAARHLESDGLLTLTGALAANGPTPGMIGYGVAKAAVHHLVKDLASPGSGLPTNAKVTAICPVTLDTPMNRSGMPTADFSSWTPTQVVAKQLYAYATGAAGLTSGSLLEVVTKNGETTFKEI